MKHPGRRDARSGAALICAVLLVAILTIGASALWRHLHITLAEGDRQEKNAVAQQLAEAGLDKAVARLRGAPAGYQGEQNTPLGEGRFSVTVLPQSGGLYRLTATGELTDGPLVLTRRTLDGELKLTPAGTIERFGWTIHKTR